MENPAALEGIPGVSGSKPSSRKRSIGQISDDGIDDGEIINISSDSDDEPSMSATAPAGWNGGKSGSGLRTSFGSSLPATAKKEPPKPEQEVVTSISSRTKQQASASSLTKAPPKALAKVKDLLDQHIPEDDRKNFLRRLQEAEQRTSTFDKHGKTWKLPPLRADALIGDTWAKACDSLLQAWFVQFKAINLKAWSENCASYTVGVQAAHMRKAYHRRLQEFPHLPKSFEGVLQHRMQIAESTESWRLQYLVESSNSTGDDPTQSLAINNKSSNSPKVEDYEMLHRYFPGVSDDADFCLACASHGHRANDCPMSTCKFCQDDHYFYECPSRQRCLKCKQLGHAKATCPEKLVMASGEGLEECAFCAGQHHEDWCTDVWQSYRPDAETKKVKSLPVSCYSCGAEGHYGGDCGLTYSQIPPTSETWTSVSLARYVDPESSEVALAFRSPQSAPEDSSLPHIAGRSIVPQRHVVYESADDDDDDDVKFSHAPVQRPQRSGNIRVANTVRFPQRRLSLKRLSTEGEHPKSPIVPRARSSKYVCAMDDYPERTVVLIYPKMIIL